MEGTVKTVDKKQDGSWTGTRVSEDYKLPITDTAVDRRNFPGAKEYHFVTKEDFFKEGDTSGSTETDSKTEPKGSGGYTKIYGGKGNKG